MALFGRRGKREESGPELPSQDGFDYAAVLSVTKPISGVHVHVEFGVSEDANYPEEFLDCLASNSGRRAVENLELGLMSATFVGLRSNDPEIEIVHYHRVLVSRDSNIAGFGEDLSEAVNPGIK